MSYLSVWLLIRQITIKFFNKNQSEWNSRLPQEHITQLYRMNPQMWHCITCFLGEKLVYLSWPDSGRQSTNKSQSKCPNVCTWYENKLLGREIAAHRYKDYYDAKAVGNPNHVGDRRSALKHVCGKAHVSLSKIFLMRSALFRRRVSNNRC